MPQKMPFQMLGVQVCLRAVGAWEFAVLVFDRSNLASSAWGDSTVG